MRNLKNEKGVITLIVIVTMLFFVTFLTSTYLILSNKAKTQVDIAKQTKKLYESENATEVYNSFFADEVSGSSVDNYVKDGLILHYDGIENTRAGHSDTAIVWEDLSGNENDGILINNNNSIIYKENGYEFTNNSDYIESGKFLGLSTDPNLTIEIVYKKYPFEANSQGNGPFTMGSTGNIDGRSFTSFFRTDKISFNSVNSSIRLNGTPVVDEKQSISYVKAIGTLNLENAKIYENGELKECDLIASTSINYIDSKIQIGRAWQYGGQDRSFKGIIYAIRIYNRVLTDEEIQQNYEIDKTRFIEGQNVITNKKRVVPIYTTEQLLKIGSNESIKINEVGGKIYNFSTSANYILMNNLEFDIDNWENILGEDKDWTPIGETNIKFDGNGKTIKVTQSNDTIIEYNEENKYKNSGYIQLEYIESTGTQRIDLEYIFTQEDEYGITFNPSAYFDSNNSFFIPMGVYTSSSSNKNIQPALSSSKTLANGRFGTSYAQMPVIEIGTTHTIIFNKTGYTVDDVYKAWTTTTANYEITNVPIFARIYGSTYNYIKQKVFAFYIKRDNVLTMNLIPAIRESDNKIGMYDTVNDDFYENAGTGTFLYPTE